MNSEPRFHTRTDDSKKTPLILKLLVILAIFSVMAGSLTGVMTYQNVGFSATFFVDWFKSFMSAWVLIPFGFMVMDWLAKRLARLMPELTEIELNLLTGMMMACIMEALMAFSTATNTIGLSDYGDFFAGWLNGFLAALPLGLTLVMIMTFTIKPKIDQLIKG